MFVGRKQELQELKSNYLFKQRRLVAIIGRRGVGKTRLNEEFKSKIHNDCTVFEFKGNKKLKRQQQINNCLNELRRKYPHIEIKPCLDWNSFFFSFLNILKVLKKQKVVVFIDEFAWLHNFNSGFVDEFASFYDKLMDYNILFVITGSAVSWMNQNVIKTSGGLHGKTHKTIKLKPFSLKETVEYLREINPSFSFKDYINYYFYTGGVVRYLEKIRPNKNLLENVKNIYENGNDVHNSEFNELFYSIFESKSTIHKDIIEAFKRGNQKTKTELSDELKYSYKAVSNAVDDLVVSDILTEKQNYGKAKKDRVYSLTDLFCYFYVKLFDGQVLNQSLLDNQQLKGAFEVLTLLNIDLIKEHIGRNGFPTKEYAWRNKHSQIDLVLDYGKERFSLIEVKFHQDIFEIKETEVRNLLNKKNNFLDSVKKKDKEMDIIIFSLFGTKNKESSFQYIDVSLKDIIG